MKLKIYDRNTIIVETTYDTLNIEKLWYILKFYHKKYEIYEIKILYQSNDYERRVGFEREEDYTYELIRPIKLNNKELYNKELNRMIDNLAIYYEIRLISCIKIIVKNSSNVYLHSYKYFKKK